MPKIHIVVEMSLGALSVSTLASHNYEATIVLHKAVLINTTQYNWGGVRPLPHWSAVPGSQLQRKTYQYRRVGSSLQVGRPKGCDLCARRNFFWIYHPGSVLAGFQLSRHSAY